MREREIERGRERESGMMVVMFGKNERKKERLNVRLKQILNIRMSYNLLDMRSVYVFCE